MFYHYLIILHYELVTAWSRMGAENDYYFGIIYKSRDQITRTSRQTCASQPIGWDPLQSKTHQYGYEHSGCIIGGKFVE
jgi:hypothetical protein